jgi:peptidoglycan/LPS O-acetylase OafA/YrhL
VAPAAASGRNRVESLDILRGLMALAVAFYHFTTVLPVFPVGQFTAYTAAKAGNYGVQGFFIISGFCFFYLYTGDSFRGGGLASFHIKRFLRIAPLYYLAVAGNLLLRQPIAQYANPRILAENATLTFGLFQPDHSLVLGGWSIGIEYVFYLAFPILAWMAGKFRPFLALAALALLAVSVHYTLYVVPFAPRAGDMNWHAYVEVGNHAFLFFLGGLVAQARQRWNLRLTGLGFWLLAGALIAAFVLRYRNFYDHFLVLQGLPRYYFAFICFGLVAVFAFRDFPASALKRAGVFLGDISYSVYLLHPFALAALVWASPKGLPAGLGFGLGLVMTLGLAAVTHRWLERPAMALGKRLTTWKPR